MESMEKRRLRRNEERKHGLKKKGKGKIEGKKEGNKRFPGISLISPYNCLSPVTIRLSQFICLSGWLVMFQALAEENWRRQHFARMKCKGPPHAHTLAKHRGTCQGPVQTSFAQTTYSLATVDSNFGLQKSCFFSNPVGCCPILQREGCSFDWHALWEDG